MSSPIEIVTVTCPQCGERYLAQYRASMNRTLDPSFDDEYVEKMSTGVCPRCGHKVQLGAIVAEIHQDGLHLWPAPGPKRPRKPSKRRTN
jgi:DNA-directed RNA polymerase subunit RPC12/RpoP